MSALNQYAVLDTCGVASPVAGMPTGLETIGAQAAVAAISVTAVAGQYRLCWCSGTLDPLQTNSSYSSLANLKPSNGTAVSYCRTAEEFLVDVGSLLLIGASTLVSDFTCIAGRDCKLDDIVGISLSDGDSIMVLDTCGEHAAALQPRARANGTQAAWQTITIPGGVYRLCWCSAAKQCNLAGRFDLDIGRLYVLGPRPLAQDRTCVSGMECAVHGIDTYGELQAGSIAILSTCGSLNGRNLWARLPLSNATSLEEPGGSSRFSTNLVTDAVMTSAGGNYKLCWCGTWVGGCETQEDFNVDFGNFHLIGPFPLKQDRTCFAGAACSLTDIVGLWITQQSEVLVMDTCGSGAETATSAAGTYKLCWCSGLSACSTASDFTVEAGDLWVMGLAPLDQDHTCVSGQSCVVDHLSGLGLSKDQIMVLETCGTNSLLYRGLDASEVTNGSTAILTWLDDLTAPGGQYRLCWCSARDGCPFPADFQVDFGQFTIIGPSPLLQTWTCISGQACRLDGITGHGTGTSAEFVIMDTCGASDSHILFYDSPVASTAHSWEDFVLSLPGAYYRMCWCAASTYPCSVAESFKVDFGRLLVVGPYPLMQDRTCVAGSSCEVDGFTGVGLSSSDLLVIRDTCADHHSRIGLPTAGALMSLTLEAGSAYVSAEGSSNNSVVFHTLSASGGQYRLCWTSWKALQLEISRASNNSENDTAATADEILDFLGGCNDTLGGNRTCAFPQMPGHLTMPAHSMLDIGRLTLIGPAPLDHVRTDHTCVSGQPCTIDGIEGLHLTAQDRMAVLDTCGDQALPLLLGHLANAPDSTSVTWDSNFLVASGGVYQLCWCSGVFGCSLAEDFQVQAGALTLIGPAPMQQHRTCVSGQYCVLEGFDVVLPTNSDSVIVLQTCGEVSSGQEPSMSHAVATLSTNGSRIDFGDAFFTASGSEYRLCWCSGNFGCNSPADFRVQLGLLKIMGMAPLNQDRTCISGQTCVVHGLQGEGLSTSARVMVLNSCGTASLVSNLVLNGVAEAVEDQGTTMNWGSTPFTASGGNYRLCWCQDQGNSSDWPDRCRKPTDFVQDAGVMTIVGVAPLNQQYTCMVGSVCSLRGISGEGLLAEDMVLVLDTCGSGKPPEGFPIAIDNTSLPTRRMTGTKYNIQWDAAAVTSAGGTYRLCWCSYFAQCSTANDFRVDMGSLTLAGPSPLRQTLTCVSGQSCILPVVSVIPADWDRGEVAVFTSCSYFTSWAPSGFPDRGQLLSEPTLPMTAPGGQYTLCWNPARADMNRTVDADIGEFQTQPGP